MASVKYQVFISSTFVDLQEERSDVIRHVLDMNHIPAGMELFPAAGIDQLEYIKKIIDECDYYVLIIGGRYGSLDEGGVSYTEREYDYAVETGKIVLAFVHGAPEALTVANSERDEEGMRALSLFREKVTAGRLVKFWTNKESLEIQVIKALNHAFNQMPQVGWVRGDTIASEVVLEQTNAALIENANLKVQIDELTAHHIPVFEDLADMSDTLVIRYQIAVPGSGSVVMGLHDYIDQSISTTWLKMFLSLAGKMGQPVTENVILNALKTLVREDGSETGVSSIFDTDRAMIKAQFIAKGLIVSEVLPKDSVSGEEYLSLTSKGQNLFLQESVVLKET